MPEKTVTVVCPKCKKSFTVQIDARYSSAEAALLFDQDRTHEGEDTTCPYCPVQLFIHWLK
jgi:hypothetical protein